MYALALSVIAGAPPEGGALEAEAIRRVAQMVEAGARKTVHIDFAGRPLRGEVLAADEDGLVVRALGQEMKVAWSTLSARRRLGVLRKHLADGSPRDRMLAAKLCLASGDEEGFLELGRAAAEEDESLASEFAQLARTEKEAPPPTAKPVPRRDPRPSVAPKKTAALFVRETAGLPRAGEPVTVGFPFPKGELRDGRLACVLGPSGRPLATQACVLARWPDNSVKWLLLDFQADVGANAVARYAVAYGPGASPPPPKRQVAYSGGGGAVNVNTGTLTVSVSRNFLSNANVEGRTVSSGSGNMFVSFNGKALGVYSSRASSPEVKVEDAGPLRVQVRVRGFHRGPGEGGEYVLRVNAYAGKSYLRIYHTFVNPFFPFESLISSVGVTMPANPPGERRVTFGAAQPHAVAAGAPGEYSLYQKSWNRHTVKTPSGAREVQGPVGWMDVSGEEAGLAFHVRDCHKLFPKRFVYRSGALTVYLWPEESGPLDLRREEEKQSPGWVKFRTDHPKGYRDWNDPGASGSSTPVPDYKKALSRKDWAYLAHHTGLGFSRTHEMTVYFHKGDASLGRVAEMCARFDSPLLAYPDPRWTDRTGVIGPCGWAANGGEDNYIARKCDWAWRHANEWFHWFGVVDWGGLQTNYGSYRGVNVGDGWTRYMGRWGWLNGEVDAPWMLAVAWLRSGDPKVFRLFEAHTRHQMDVDTCHANAPQFPRPGRARHQSKGGMHRHEYNHYGGGAGNSHTWAAGIITYGYATGYRRAFDVGREIGDFFMRLPGGGSNMGNYLRGRKDYSRNSSLAYWGLVKAYELTGKKEYLDEIGKWREHFFSASPESFDWSTFYTGLYLVYAYQADYDVLGEKRAGDELVKIARWQIEKMQADRSDWTMPYTLLAPAYAYFVTKEKSFLEVPRRLWLRRFSSSSDSCTGKTDCRSSRFYEFGQVPYFRRALIDAGM